MRTIEPLAHYQDGEFDCYIIRVPNMGHLCGYIGVPAGHPWDGKGYDDIDADVHGGLTFAKPASETLFPGTQAAWYVGFDCAHAGDLVPGTARYRDPEVGLLGLMEGITGDSRLAIGGGEVLRDETFVRGEIAKLVEQARAAGYGLEHLPAIPLGDEQESDVIPKIVVVVRGGVVVSVMSQEPLEYALVDFDNEENGGKAWEHGWEPAEPWDAMDEEVAAALGDAA